MSIHKKLMQARLKLQTADLKKSGHNKFAGYKYFELGDFLPTIQEICNEVGICGTVTFYTDIAILTITDMDDATQFIEFKCPMSSAALKGCHDVQNLGAVQTYLRRYLWTNAFEIVEHDALDATMGKDEPAKKVEAKVEPKVEPKVEKPKATSGPWQISLADNEDIGAWMSTLGAGCDALLAVATSVDDVATIFKTNRSVFDKAKALDEVGYSKLMEKFSATKKSLTKA
jgi:hypothetical protein